LKRHVVIAPSILRDRSGKARPMQGSRKAKKEEKMILAWRCSTAEEIFSRVPFPESG
jgi:hypothetical protein